MKIGIEACDAKRLIESNIDHVVFGCDFTTVNFYYITIKNFAALKSNNTINGYFSILDESISFAS